ncbi:MAG: type II toxin-antitoxin system VapC family toxin [Methylovulum sp.]|uniref:PIN domain-containing protein n=1 Tax=Methylovulum sp. TaxID=1916980 RepID=UPI002621134B|nr:type II toxin-antitoxin system VapC family toxin [Methylovulum sp.]MDD2723116.1 type II toxin-antitoxin system VapC family toxin [Methylovulum sp.]MDD5124831.1 type II toxin-antitoxin system VapC family toxin [Methylovulum sp.]
MITIDTNVLVRVIVEDTGQTEQTKIARELVENAESVYVPQIVQVETIWVLTKTYKIDKAALLGVLEHLLLNPAFILQRQAIFKTALDLFKQSQAGFADCLILAESLDANAPLHTFDKRLGKHASIQLL